MKCRNNATKQNTKQMRAFKKLDLQIKAFIIATFTLTILVSVMILTKGFNAL